MGACQLQVKYLSRIGIMHHHKCSNELLIYFCKLFKEAPDSLWALWMTTVEAPVTNHSRDFVLDVKKYKMVQIFLVLEDRNQEDCKKVIGKFIPQIEFTVNI